MILDESFLPLLLYFLLLAFTNREKIQFLILKAIFGPTPHLKPIKVNHTVADISIKIIWSVLLT